MLLVLAASVIANPAHEGLPLTVKYVVENARALDGKEIVIGGWIKECWQLSCSPYDSAKEVKKDWPYVLSIGPSSWFESLMRNRVPGRVIIKARMYDRCVTNPATQTIAACADRPTTLEPLAVVR